MKKLLNKLLASIVVFHVAYFSAYFGINYWKAQNIQYVLSINDLESYLLDYLPIKYNLYMISLLIDSNDSILLDITSSGGYTIWEIEIIQELESIGQPMSASINLYAHSAGATLASLATDVEVSEYSEVLFHKPRQILNGRIRLLQSGQPLYSMHAKIDRRYVYPLLTPSEVLVYDAGGDVVLTGQEFKKRVENR